MLTERNRTDTKHSRRLRLCKKLVRNKSLRHSRQANKTKHTHTSREKFSAPPRPTFRPFFFAIKIMGYPIEIHLSIITGIFFKPPYEGQILRVSFFAPAPLLQVFEWSLIIYKAHNHDNGRFNRPRISEILKFFSRVLTNTEQLVGQLRPSIVRKC